MSSFSIGEFSFNPARSVDEFNQQVAEMNVKHGDLQNQTLLFAFETGKEVTKCVTASLIREEQSGILHLLFELLGRPDFKQTGFISRTLEPKEVSSLVAALTPFYSEVEKHPYLRILKKAEEEETPVTCTVLNKEIGDEKLTRDYLRHRTTILFDAFNEGTLRGSDTMARQALLDSFNVLPNRYLTAEGDFIYESENAADLIRQVPKVISASDQTIGGIDKFPSLMSVRGARLREDKNRIMPSVMIRDGVHIGKRNIFLFHCAVNMAAFIGDDNLVDSHASIASSAQIGNRNKIGSFVSLEGVLSPANAEPVFIGDDNFIGTFVRIGTGIKIGDKNFIGAGVNISLGTKIRDCRTGSNTKGEYTTPKELNPVFSGLSILPNNAEREFNGVKLHPGEYLVFENTESFMERFTTDDRLRAK